MRIDTTLATLTLLPALLTTVPAVADASPGADAPPTCHGRPATLVLDHTSGRKAVGTEGDDVIVVGRNSPVERVAALGGDDLVCVLTARRLPGVIANGGAGDDVLDGRAAATLMLFDGKRGDDVLVGGPSADYLTGDAGHDRLVGGAGNDHLAPGGGDDFVFGGGGGRDEFSLRVYDASVTVDVPRGTMRGEGTDRIHGVETFFAGSGDDVFRGGPRAEEFNGEEGNDRMTGGAGDDVLLGGSGRDLADGQAGRDQCWAEVRKRCEIEFLF